MSLITENNMGESCDHVYNLLLDAHKDLSTEQSQRLNTRLVLILMNQVGTTEIIEAAIALAKNNVTDSKKTNL